MNFVILLGWGIVYISFVWWMEQADMRKHLEKLNIYAQYALENYNMQLVSI